MANVPRPVLVSVPRRLSVPNCAVCAKRFVLEAVVEKRLVVVALASVVLPVTPSVPATERLPAESNVLVAVPPKYAVPNTERSDVDALENEERPVNVFAVEPDCV